MLLKRLTMKNFFSHQHSVLDFDKLNPISMVLGAIDGDFRESNGSGKTTIIEAVLFSLYEKTRLTENKNATLDDMVRWGSDGKMEVALEFEIDKKLYKITRTRDKNKSKGTASFESFLNGKWQSLVESKKNETNKSIVKLIGVDYETFCASICFQQKEIDSFVNATESERKSIIKNILQLDKYDNYRDRAKVKVSLLESEIQALDKILEISSNITILDLEKKREEEKNLELITSSLQIQKQAIEKQIEKLRKEQILFNEVVEKKLNYKKQISNKTASIESLDRQIANSKVKLEDYQVSFQRKKDEFKALKEKHDSIRNQFTIEKSEILKEGKQIDSKLKEAEKEYEQVLSDLSKESGEIERIERTILNISRLCDEKCQTCYSPITEESKRANIEYLNSYKISIMEKRKTLQEKLNTAKAMVDGYKTKLEEAKEKLQEYGRWAKEKLHLEDTMKIIKDFVDEAKLTIADQKRILEENQKLKESIEKELEAIKEQLDKLVVDDKSFEQINLKLFEKNKDLEIAVSSLSTKQLEKGRIQNQIIQIEDQIQRTKNARAQKDSLIKEKFHYTELVKMFGKEIPTLIVENACFELAEEANKVLNSISQDVINFVTQRKNKDGSFKECFEIEIFRPGVETPILIDSLSNGQKFRVVFAIRIALSRLLARRRSSTPIEFLFYDECFASLDDKGIEDIIDIFRYLKSEFKHQIIITHGIDLKERFSSSFVLIDQNRNGVSKIVQNN